MDLNRFFLEFSYAGTAYHGWQSQPNVITVQEVIEDALKILLKETISLTAAGRTDTGVHAKIMFAHFEGIIKKKNLSQLIFRLNQFLPKDISIHNLHRVQPNAHARFDAISRTYEYHISEIKSPFTLGQSYILKQSLDLKAMNAAASILLEYEDFECFSKSNSDVKTFFCNITHARWKKNGNKLVFTITANRFLRNMVRAIVGTLIEIGLGKKNINQIHHIIKSKSRSLAGYSVPAKGLFLTHIDYPDSIYIEHGKG